MLSIPNVIMTFWGSMFMFSLLSIFSQLTMKKGVFHILSFKLNLYSETLAVFFLALTVSIIMIFQLQLSNSVDV